MKTKILGWFAALGLVGATLSFGACSQPKPDCQVALASTYDNYAAKYTVKGTPSAACENRIIPGESLGMEFYHPPTDDGTTYDQKKTTFGIQSEYLASLVAAYAGAAATAHDAAFAHAADDPPVLPCDLLSGPDADQWQEWAPLCQQCVDANDPDAVLCADHDTNHHPYSLLTFASSSPNEKDMCSDAPSQKLLDSTYTFPAVPAVPANPEFPDDPTVDAVPGLSVKYEWKNVQVYVTAAAPGTQFSADLTYTEDDCTVEYSVVGMWPLIYCEGTDAEGNGTSLPDDTLCDPCPPEGAPYGSRISPDFPTKCDPEMLVCVLADKKDAKKDPQERAAATSIPQILDTPIDCGPVE